MTSDPLKTIARAAKVSGDSVHAEMAIAVCKLRGVDPYKPNRGALSAEIELVNWQAVIAENDILAAMRGFSTVPFDEG